VGSAGHVVHSRAFRERNIDALFFKIRWAWYGFHKKRIGTHYAELVFLHLVGSADHVVCSGASDPRNVDAQFFMLGWDQCRFNKKCAETHYAKDVSKDVFLHPVGYAGHVVHSHASVA
jgi:hypothetical protein